MKLKISVTFLVLGTTILMTSMQMVSGVPWGDSYGDEDRKDLGHKGHGNGEPINTVREVCYRCRGEKEPDEEREEPKVPKRQEGHGEPEHHERQEEHGKGHGYDEPKNTERIVCYRCRGEREPNEEHREPQTTKRPEDHREPEDHEGHKGHGGHLGKGLIEHKEKVLSAVMDHKEKFLGAVMDHKDKLLGAAMNHKEKFLGAVMDHKDKVLGAVMDHKDKMLGAVMDHKEKMVGSVIAHKAKLAGAMVGKLGTVMKHLGTIHQLGGMLKGSAGSIGQMGDALKAPLDMLKGHHGH